MSIYINVYKEYRLALESAEPVFGEGGELRLIYLKFDMLKKQAKTRKKNPNQTTTKPTPLHEITTTTMFLFKILSKIRHYILFWCSVHGFIAVYIFFCTVQA